MLKPKFLCAFLIALLTSVPAAEQLHAQDESGTAAISVSMSADLYEGLQARVDMGHSVFGVSGMKMSAFSLNEYVDSGSLFAVEFVTADGDLKKVPDKDIKKIDAHKFKEDFVGKENVSKYNIYKDKDGKVVLVPVKKDSGLENVETGMTWDEVLEDYPAKKKNLGPEVGPQEVGQIQ